MPLNIVESEITHHSMAPLKAWGTVMDEPQGVIDAPEEGRMRANAAPWRARMQQQKINGYIRPAPNKNPAETFVCQPRTGG
jgi:hypothetical protein